MGVIKRIFNMKLRPKASNTLKAYLFLLPALLGLTFLTIGPIIGMVFISMTKWTGLEPPTFVGFENYVKLFTVDNFFFDAVGATLNFALGAVILGTVYTFSVAWMLNRKVPACGFFRSVFFMPYVVPQIGATIIWAWMYESNFGIFNYFLNLLGMDKVQFLTDDRFATPALVVMAVWGLGNMIVIFLAGLQNVPKTLYEVVEIDGGTGWHKFIHITIPMMSPIILFNFLMIMVLNMQVFVPAYAVTKGAPNNSTLYIVYLIYREGFRNNNFGHAAALSLVFIIFIGLVTLLIFKTSKNLIFAEGE